MPRRHALTDAEHQLIQEGLDHLLLTADMASHVAPLTSEERKQLRLRATALRALATRMAATQRGRTFNGYATARLKQQLQRRKTSQERRLRKHQQEGVVTMSRSLRMTWGDGGWGFLAAGQRP